MDDSLLVDQNKISKCEHCGGDMVWLLRRSNVNNTLTDDDIRSIAQRGLGDKMQEWCESCNMFTLQTVVAYDLATTSNKKEDL